MVRSLTLFVHLVGVLGLFVGLGLEWFSLESLRRATSRGEALSWVRVIAALPRVGSIATGLVLASGLYLGARIGALDNAWLRASYAALLLIAVLGGSVTRRGLGALRRLADDPADRALPKLRAAASHPLLIVSLRVRVVIGLAIVFLMIAKPDTTEALLVLATAAVTAIVASVSGRPASPALSESYRTAG